jgi:hypothetical protein
MWGEGWLSREKCEMGAEVGRWGAKLGYVWLAFGDGWLCMEMGGYVGRWVSK